MRAKERNRQAKHIRDGLVAKQKERSEKQLEEVCRHAIVEVSTDATALTGEAYGKLPSCAEAIIRGGLSGQAAQKEGAWIEDGGRFVFKRDIATQ